MVIYNYHLSHLGDKSLRDVRHNIINKEGRRPSNGNEKFLIYSESLNNFAKILNKKGIQIVLIGSSLRNNKYEISAKEWFRPNLVQK